ncbi:IS110 family transposase [Streptomyces lavendulae]|uniref:IS110 family transposase n=1 Tax=Streptomyces lavendulae TaxID=1914 RepID=UPI0036A493AF
MPELWAGTDAGKAAHHCTVIDTNGAKVLSRRVPNNEPDLLELIGDVLAPSGDGTVTWAVDLNTGGGALLIALLSSHGQRLLYIPGRTVHHASRGYRGDGKTDAKDAYVIADQARMRRDLQPLQAWDEIAVDLKILTGPRYDLAADRTRAINRMRAQLLEYFPALERTFDYAASKAALILLTDYQTQSGLRRVGPSRLATWLKNRKVRGAQAMADAAVAAAQAQHTAVAGESTAAVVVSTLARTVLALDEERRLTTPGWNGAPPKRAAMATRSPRRAGPRRLAATRSKFAEIGRGAAKGTASWDSHVRDRCQCLDRLGRGIGRGSLDGACRRVRTFLPEAEGEESAGARWQAAGNRRGDQRPRGSAPRDPTMAGLPGAGSRKCINGQSGRSRRLQSGVGTTR